MRLRDQSSIVDFTNYRLNKDSFLDHMGSALVKCRLIVVRISPETIRKRLNEVFNHFDIHDKNSLNFEELVEVYATIKLGRGALVASSLSADNHLGGTNSSSSSSSGGADSHMVNGKAMQNRRASAPSAYGSGGGVNSSNSSATVVSVFEDSHLSLGRNNRNTNTSSQRATVVSSHDTTNMNMLGGSKSKVGEEIRVMGGVAGSEMTVRSDSLFNLTKVNSHISLLLLTYITTMTNTLLFYHCVIKYHNFHHNFTHNPFPHITCIFISFLMTQQQK